MGACCSCTNCANKLLGISMTMLCVCLSVYTWWKFDNAYGVGDGTIESCADSNGTSEERGCQALAATGSLTIIAALVALFGSCSASTEKNQASISAAFGLLNLAWAVLYLQQYDEANCTDESASQKPCSIWMASGIFNIVGFFLGLIYALYTCRSGYQGNNILYVASMFFYMLSQANWKWYEFDEAGCSTDSLEDESKNIGDGPSSTDKCVTDAFGGSFVLFAMLLCLIAGFMSFSSGQAQGKFQQFALAFSVGMACLVWTCDFWYKYGHASNYNEEACSDTDPKDSNTSFCVSMVIGGLSSMVGFPIALFTAFAFCCGCISEDGRVDYDGGYKV